jgi:hypothetical protein
MHLLDLPARPAANDVPLPHPCESVQGVEFWIRSASGRRLRCVITEAALQAHYGAIETEESWVEAFLRHRADIELRACDATGRREDVHVVLLTDSDGRLKTAVGRCGA